MNRFGSNALPLPPGPDGLAVDLECPKCTYNLRGLTQPRCPECGFHFEWHDVPRLLLEAEMKPSRRERIIRGAVWTVVVIVILPIVAYLLPVFLALGVALLVTMGLAGLQALFEMLVVRLLTDEICDVHFRRWWEGVLISYGAAALTCFFLGLDVLAALEGGWSHLTVGMWFFLVLLAAELIVLQYAVIAMRENHWGYPIRPVRAVVGVAISKTFMIFVLGVMMQM